MEGEYVISRPPAYRPGPPTGPQAPKTYEKERASRICLFPLVALSFSGLWLVGQLGMLSLG